MKSLLLVLEDLRKQHVQRVIIQNTDKSFIIAEGSYPFTSPADLFERLPDNTLNKKVRDIFLSPQVTGARVVLG